MSLIADRPERVRGRSALEALEKRRLLTARQVRAGKRLAGTYAAGILGTMPPERGPRVAGPSYAMEARIAASQDYHGARAFMGARLWPVVWAVVCGDQPVQEVATERRMNPTACMALLKLALDLLADRYGLPEDT